MGGGDLLPLGPWNLSIPLQNGWMGVNLFFVLSGFLICHHILRRWGDGFRWADVRSYLLKRVLRIAPAYYAFLFIVASGCLPFHSVDPDRLGARVVYHLFFLHDYFGSDIVVAFWSLGVEEEFYLLAPFLLIPLLKMRSLGRVTLALTALFLLPLLMRGWSYAQQPQITTYEHCFNALRSPAHLCSIPCWWGPWSRSSFATRIGWPC
jgi:peptidoglycan/LPS O-acetylase OafA/YrhL